MLMESLAITLVILIITVLFLRRSQKMYALATVPLVILPFGHVVSSLAAQYIVPHVPLDFAMVVMAGDCLALVLSAVLLGVVSQQFAGKRGRRVYLWTCGTFLIVLAWVFIKNLFV